MHRKRFHSSINGKDLDNFGGEGGSNLSTSISYLSEMKEPSTEAIPDEQLLTRIAKIWTDMHQLKQQIQSGNQTSIRQYLSRLSAGVLVAPQITPIEDRLDSLSSKLDAHVASS
jgi:hypothetical protein